MYKSSLQTLCQKKHWDLPLYETSKQGLDHLPKFTATVKVNGLTFQAPSPCGTAKEAQNEAASVAFHCLSNTACATLSSSSPGSVIPSTVSADSSASIASLHSDRPAANQNSQAARNSLTCDHVPKRIQNIYKNQLINYAQKKSLVLPIYSSHVEGPPHAPLYKANVTINGRSYECTEFYSTVKDAEQDAARVALMSLVPFEEDEAGLFKNLLQVFAQRNGLQLPAYMTDMSARCSRTSFVSTVEIGGWTFIGQEAGSKKQAEINAARVAYKTLKDRSVIPSTVSADSLASIGSLHSDIPAAKQNSPVTGTALTSDHVPKRIQNVYKNQLQHYAQKKSWALPVYSSIGEGPPHARRFKANVTIDGQSYESIEFHSTVKDAEQDAARVALMSLVPSEEASVQLNEAGLLKNLSEVSAQKNGLEVPANVMNLSTGGPMPAHVSIVETRGQAFTGQEARSKKQTVINADSVACNTLNCKTQDCSQLPDTVSTDPVNEAKASSLNGASASPPQQSTLLPSAPSSAISDTELQAGVESVPNGYYNKVVVYPRSAGRKFKGGSVLPISDDQWIAVKFVA